MHEKFRYITLLTSENQTLNLMTYHIAKYWLNLAKLSRLTKYCVLNERGKFGAKNILTLHRYHDFRVGIFYSDSPCISNQSISLYFAHKIVCNGFPQLLKFVGDTRSFDVSGQTWHGGLAALPCKLRDSAICSSSCSSRRRSSCVVVAAVCGDTGINAVSVCVCACPRFVL